MPRCSSDLSKQMVLKLKMLKQKRLDKLACRSAVEAMMCTSAHDTVTVGDVTLGRAGAVLGMHTAKRYARAFHKGDAWSQGMVSKETPAEQAAGSQWGASYPTQFSVLFTRHGFDLTIHALSHEHKEKQLASDE